MSFFVTTWPAYCGSHEKPTAFAACFDGGVSMLKMPSCEHTQFTQTQLNATAGGFKIQIVRD